MARSVASWAGHALALDVRSLAAFRIALGAVVLADALLRTRDVTLMLAPDGMFPLAVLRDFFGDRWAWSLAFLVDATWWGAAIVVLEGLAGTALAAGVHTRAATVAAWVAVVSIVRRTAPATNAGDEWLACLLFWSMFLPLGATWSIDAARRPRLPAGPTVCSPATAALLLQIAAVYLGAGISKCNPSWWSGSAVSSALSLHDHGTAWGEALSHYPEACRLLGWALLGLELVGPCVLLATSRAGVRSALVATFLGFHAATAVLMTLGLFAYVGMAAWLVVVPSAWWDRCLGRAGRAGRSGPPSSGSPPAPSLRPAPTVATAIVGMALVVAGIAFAHANTAWRQVPLPGPIQAAVRATCLSQDWGMFGAVPDQRQWVYGRGRLADGRQVDVLRDGRPFEETLPAGGYTSLPHHRWHKIFWELPKPARRIFSPSIAAALARDWNRRHPEDQRLVALDIRAVRLQGDAASGTRHELLLASWPPRDAAGTGGLDRWLERHGTR